jgi:hypothetical protein
MMRKILGAAALLSVLLAGAGCAGGGSAGGGGGGGDLPGVREFGLSDAQFVDHVERTQALMAECMKRAGFEYVPVDVATIERAQASNRREPGLTDRQYHERWGYSISTRFDDPVRTIGLGPNVQLMEGLSDADREAYEFTLLGPARDSDFAFTLDDEDFSSTGGCTREAVAQVFTPEQLEGTYVNPKDVLVEQDPRIIEAQNNWTTCMHEKGYNYKDDQDVIMEEYEERLDALLDGDDPATLTGERLDALHAMQAEEIKVSLADKDCEERYTDAVFAQVETEVFGRPVSG